MKVVAQGTGEVLDTARRGDADVVFVHANRGRRFLGRLCVKRYPGCITTSPDRPEGRTAGIKGSKDIVAVLCAIKAKGADLISRGEQVRHPSGRSTLEGRGIDIAKDKGPGTRRSARAWALR